MGLKDSQKDDPQISLAICQRQRLGDEKTQLPSTALQILDESGWTSPISLLPNFRWTDARCRNYFTRTISSELFHRNSFTGTLLPEFFHRNSFQTGTIPKEALSNTLARTTIP